MKPSLRSASRLLTFLTVLSVVAAACTSEATEETNQATTTEAGVLEDESTTTTAVDETAIQGGPFVVGLVANITTDNWWASLDTENQAQNEAYLSNMKPSLFKLTYPGFVFVPDMAATDEPAAAVPRGDVWVVEQPIRDDRTWSDGTSITAHDFVLYFEAVREFSLGSEHARSLPSSVVDASASDDYTLRLEFASEPQLADWRSGVGLANWVPAHYWQEHVAEARASAEAAVDAITDEAAISAIVDASLADDRFDNDLAPEDVTPEDIAAYIADVWAVEGRNALYAVSPAGEPSSGPMILERWDPGAVAVTVGNVDYDERGTETTLYEDGSVRITNAERQEDRVFGGDGSGDVVSSYVEGPFVSEIRWVEHGSRQEAYEELAAGNLDYVYDPAGLTLDVRDQLAQNTDLRFTSNQAEGFRYMAFNLRKPPMSDIAFRQAVSAVVNKEFLAETVLEGAVIPAYTIVHPDLTVWYNPDVNKPGWFDGAPGTDAQRFEYAIRTLTEAGYTWETEPVIGYDAAGNPADVDGGAGLTMPNGERVPELKILAPGQEDDPFRATFAAWIETWMNQLGIPAVVESTDFSSIIDAVFPPQTVETAQEWDLYILGWGQMAPALPGLSHVAFFHSREDVVLGGGFNTSGFANTDFDAVADAFESATTVAEAQRLTWEMEEILQDELPYIMLFRTAVIEAFSSRVHFPTDVIMGGHHAFPKAWPNAVQVDD